jgi:hypothetical protein
MIYLYSIIEGLFFTDFFSHSLDLCYETLMCLNRSFKISSVKELNDIEDIDNARMICDHCEYSKL